MNLKYLECNVSEHYADIDVETIPDENHKDSIKFTLHISFNQCKGEYPSGGVGDSIEYTPCVVIEDTTVYQIEVTEGITKGFHIDHESRIQTFVDSVTSINGDEFYEFINTLIGEHV